MILKFTGRVEKILTGSISVSNIINTYLVYPLTCHKYVYEWYHLTKESVLFFPQLWHQTLFSLSHSKQEKLLFCFRVRLWIFSYYFCYQIAGMLTFRWNLKSFSNCPPNLPARPPKLLFILKQFQDGGFCFLGTNRELAESRPIWRSDLSFCFGFRRSAPTCSILWSHLQKDLPIGGQRSSCGTEFSKNDKA